MTVTGLVGVETARYLYDGDRWKVQFHVPLPDFRIIWCVSGSFS